MKYPVAVGVRRDSERRIRLLDDVRGAKEECKTARGEAHIMCSLYVMCALSIYISCVLSLYISCVLALYTSCVLSLSISLHRCIHSAEARGEAEELTLDLSIHSCSLYIMCSRDTMCALSLSIHTHR